MFGHDEPDDDQDTNVVQPEPATNAADTTTQDTTASDSSTISDQNTVHVDIDNNGEIEPSEDTPTPSDSKESSAGDTPDTPQKDDSEEEKSESTKEDKPTEIIGGNSALLEIKRSALQELSPLLDELSQPPEEKFRTTMMMIQAFDDQKLIGKAYEAAKGIKDRKERAEALLDIVNEINYFTQEDSESANE